jgi:uncharacterized protein
MWNILMRRLLFWGIFISLTISAFAQGNITGQWNGLLPVNGMHLRIVFHVAKVDSGYSGTMDSPDQGAKGLAVSSITYEKAVLKIILASADIHYEGTLTADDKLAGVFKQRDVSLPLTLTREKSIEEPIARMQDPKEPYPYSSQDVSFVNGSDSAILAGTLTLPDGSGPFPAVVLISGSGPQDRNEEIMNHRPFLVLADYLTRNGIAVLRYDDRGTAKSTGDFSKATTLDLADDAEAAVSYLLTRQEINKKKIGLVGHSEGGIIAPMVAARNKQVRFIVLMAGTGMRGKELLLLQQKLIGKANGVPEELLKKSQIKNQQVFDILLNTNDDDQLIAFLKKTVVETPAAEKPLGVKDEDLVQQQLTLLTSPWFKYFLKYDPAPVLVKVKCPVFVLGGSKDLQVPPRENISILKSSLEKGGNKNVTIREFPGLNHLFQECQTGSPKEYQAIEQTLSPQVLREISAWILKQTK